MAGKKTKETIEIVSAVPLDQERIKKIRKIIVEKTGVDTRIKKLVDNRIIGGLIIRINDVLIDFSIRSQLEALRKNLQTIQLKVEEYSDKNKI